MGGMKILIGYDGSPFADAAIDDLQRAGLPADTAALVLSVADVWPSTPPVYREALVPGTGLEVSMAVADTAAARTKAAEAEAAELAGRARARVAGLFPGWSVEAESTADSPASALTERAERWGADLIVIGSHGRGALSRLFFGSISQKVLRYAHCSVRVGRRPPERPPGGLRVLLGLDTSEGAAAALGAVAARAWPAGTVVHLVTAVDVRLATVAIPVIESPIGGAESYAGGAVAVAAAADEQAWLRDAQREAADELRRAGLEVTCAVRDGDAKHVLLAEAEARHVDLVVLGAKGISRIERFLLGSVSSAVAARAHCSVEVVRFE
jgi:nucleotide-binding universal stress UspA family protein